MDKKDHSKELQKILSNQNLLREPLEKEEAVAFGSEEDFKTAIGKDEFTSVIILLTHIVNKIIDSLDVRQNAKETAIKKVKELRDSGMSDSDVSYAVKVIKRELMNTDIKVYNSFKDEFDNLVNTIEFLNRFKVPQEMFPYPNLNWITKVKKYLQNKNNK